MASKKKKGQLVNRHSHPHTKYLGSACTDTVPVRFAPRPFSPSKSSPDVLLYPSTLHLSLYWEHHNPLIFTYFLPSSSLILQKLSSNNSFFLTPSAALPVHTTHFFFLCPGRRNLHNYQWKFLQNLTHYVLSHLESLINETWNTSIIQKYTRLQHFAYLQFVFWNCTFSQ